MDDCLFCGIARGDVPARIIARSDRAMAFMDIFPAVDGHALVIPLRHADDALAADPEDLAATMDLARRVGGAAETALGATGVTFLSCARPDGWQTVPHLHVHVLPRRTDDGLTIPWPVAAGDDTALDALAARLSDAL